MGCLPAQAGSTGWMNDERRARYARCGIVAILCCEWGCRIPGEQIPGEPWGVGSEALLGGFRGDGFGQPLPWLYRVWSVCADPFASVGDRMIGAFAIPRPVAVGKLGRYFAQRFVSS